MPPSISEAWIEPRPSSGCTFAPSAASSSARRDEERPGLDDRVDSEVRPRAVRGAPGDLELEPDEPLVRDDELELGRLGHDRGVGAHRLEHLLDPEARVLLVGDRGDDDVARETQRAASRQAIRAAATPAFMS